MLIDPQFAADRAQEAFAEGMAAFERRDRESHDRARLLHEAWSAVYYRLTRGLSGR